jgi:hypothetical protein
MRDLAELERSIEAHPDRTQRFLIKAARLLPSLPGPAVQALEVAERFHAGTVEADDLEAARVSCWDLCDTGEGRGTTPEVAAVRAAICALFPSLDDPFETVCFFFDMSRLTGDPVSEPLDLLREELARVARRG